MSWDQNVYGNLNYFKYPEVILSKSSWKANTAWFQIIMLGEFVISSILSHCNKILKLQVDQCYNPL